MKWINRNDSESNYEDRRGRGVKRGAAFGGVGMIIVAIIVRAEGVCGRGFRRDWHYPQSDAGRFRHGNSRDVCQWLWQQPLPGCRGIRGSDPNFAG